MRVEAQVPYSYKAEASKFNAKLLKIAKEKLQKEQAVAHPPRPAPTNRGDGFSELKRVLDDWPTAGINPINLPSSYIDNAKIYNYRCPVPNHIDRQGIVFFVHEENGANLYRGKLAEMFANKGYEFCGID